MSALVYHSGALGDFLTVLPAVGAWRHAHPKEKVILLGKPAYGVIAFHSGYIDEVRDVGSASNAWLFSSEAALPANAREIYSHVNTAVLFAAPDSPVALRLSAAGVREFYSQAPFPDRRISASLYHLSLFPRVTHLLDHFGPIIRANPDFRQGALELLEGIDDYIAIHPGSGSEVKNWPFENFAALSQECQRRGIAIVWIYGEAESDLPVVPGALVVRNAPLPILVHLLKMSRAYIGNDSGISHLAAGAGCRSTVLFGPSDDAVWKPQGSHVTVVKARRCLSPCHPFREGSSRCGNSCMRRLSVEEVFETFKRNIGG
jgi:heptosyltransferase-3